MQRKNLTPAEGSYPEWAARPAKVRSGLAPPLPPLSHPNESPSGTERWRSNESMKLKTA